MRLPRVGPRRRGGTGCGARPRRSGALRAPDCSALLGRAARRGNSLRSFVATLRQSRRVRQRSTRCAATGPACRPRRLARRARVRRDSCSSELGCAARRLPRAPQPAPPRLRLERVGASEKPALPALGEKGRRRGRRRAWEAPSSAGGRAARAARFVNLTRRDCLSAATKERREFPRRALCPSSAGESGSRSEPDRRGRAPPPAPPALRCRLND